MRNKTTSPESTMNSRHNQNESFENGGGGGGP